MMFPACEREGLGGIASVYMHKWSLCAAKHTDYHSAHNTSAHPRNGARSVAAAVSEGLTAKRVQLLMRRPGHVWGARRGVAIVVEVGMWM
ncbi:unnamed protein product [Arctogadus glacialis]